MSKEGAQLVNLNFFLVFSVINMFTLDAFIGEQKCHRLIEVFRMDAGDPCRGGINNLRANSCGMKRLSISY